MAKDGDEYVANWKIPDTMDEWSTGSHIKVANMVELATASRRRRGVESLGDSLRGPLGLIGVI